MGFIPAKLLPSCESMCVCCPALRPSSRRPVKRYKKLLAEIFPKAPDGQPNERKIMKLCEYAAKNPLRIPKIAKFLEQRSHKELRAAHVNFLRIITEAYSKLLFICKEQMAYFAISLVNVLTELLESKQENIHILGCQTLASFINNQVDNTYARNIESLVRKVCVLSRLQGEEHSLLRAASLQCLSAMIFFMKEHSYIFADFDEIVQSVLENYKMLESAGDGGGDRNASQHNWVDEIARCEGRPGLGVGNDVNFSSTTTRLRPARDPSSLTREERESPEIWSHICVQKLAELAKESTTMRRVLDPMLSYFDMKKQWAPRHGLALLVLSDMAFLEKSSGNEQLILTAVIRHLDHKNVSHDPQTKTDIIQTATSLARQLRSRGVAAELVVAGDLCKHLRKTLEAVESTSACVEELNLNETLQTFLEDCLLEVVRGIKDVRPLYDMMAITLENLPSIPTVARATIGSLLILSHIISLTSISSKTPMVFPEALLQQILKSMIHPDVDTRVGAHHMFSAVIVRGPSHPRNESEYLYETKKWQSRTTSVFASATALLEKLRKEKGSSDKPRNVMHDDVKERNMHEEENKHVWARRNSAYFSKLVLSFTDRCTALNSSAEETNIAMLTEDQTNQLLSAFWIQAHQTDNTPFNYEAIGHSYSLTVLSSRLECSNNSNIVQFFQLPLSLRSIALTPNGVLPASCQRSIFTLATSMLAFAGKVCHITELADLLRCFTSSNIDPYLRIGEDFQLYVRLQSDLSNYGSESDQEGAKSILSDCRAKVGISDQQVLDVTASALSGITKMGKDALTKELTEMFTPEEVPLFGSSSALDWANFHLQAFSDESLSFDEECSRTSSVDCGLHESPITNTASSISKTTLPQSVPHVLGVGQLLESALHVAGQVAGASVSTSPLPYGTMTSQCEALGLGTRKKLSSWLINGHETTPDNPMPSLPSAHQSIIPKVNSCGFEGIHRTSSEPCSAVKLPPASPFDNFLKAAYRTQPEL